MRTIGRNEGSHSGAGATGPGGLQFWKLCRRSEILPLWAACPSNAKVTPSARVGCASFSLFYRGDAGGHATSGRPVAHLFYPDLHTALIQARGAPAAEFNRAVYERLKPSGSYVIVDHSAAVGTGTSNAQSLHRIEPAPFAMKWRRPAWYWTRKAPCSRTRTIRTRSRCSIPRSRARPIASPIGS
jgi:hypothetical protein